MEHEYIDNIDLEYFFKYVIDYEKNDYTSPKPRYNPRYSPRYPQYGYSGRNQYPSSRPYPGYNSPYTSHNQSAYTKPTYSKPTYQQRPPVPQYPSSRSYDNYAGSY